jgi:hypothetical protein
MEDQNRTTRDDPTGPRYPELRLKVAGESLAFFTTLLQYGVEIETTAGITIDEFLCNCPGFSKKYLSETVQTIFLDGTAVDDLKTPLSGPHPVVALSAAMPGLAGAIFRKNGLHSALRTPSPASPSNHTPQKPLTVTLKLFNRIARDKGARFLSEGAVMAPSSLSAFLGSRPELLDNIQNATIDSKPVSIESLSGEVGGHEFVKLFVSADIPPS